MNYGRIRAASRCSRLEWIDVRGGRGGRREGEREGHRAVPFPSSSGSVRIFAEDQLEHVVELAVRGEDGTVRGAEGAADRRVVGRHAAVEADLRRRTARAGEGPGGQAQD